MIDRFGRRISVGWPEHHLEWIRAALTLDWKERQEAYRDISELTGRGIKAVRDRAKVMKDMEKRHLLAAQRRVMRLPAWWSLPPSQLRKPSMAQLMAGRA